MFTVLNYTFDTVDNLFIFLIAILDVIVLDFYFLKQFSNQNKKITINNCTISIDRNFFRKHYESLNKSEKDQAKKNLLYIFAYGSLDKKFKSKLYSHRIEEYIRSIYQEKKYATKILNKIKNKEIDVDTNLLISYVNKRISLFSLFTYEVNYDVYKILINDTEFILHKKIISKKSHYFKKLFSGNFDDCSSESIYFDIPIDDIKDFLFYFYDSEPRIDKNNIIGFHILANYFDCPELQSKIEKYLGYMYMNSKISGDLIKKEMFIINNAKKNDTIYLIGEIQKDDYQFHFSKYIIYNNRVHIYDNEEKSKKQKYDSEDYDIVNIEMQDKKYFLSHYNECNDVNVWHLINENYSNELVINKLFKNFLHFMFKIGDLDIFNYVKNEYFPYTRIFSPDIATKLSNDDKINKYITEEFEKCSDDNDIINYIEFELKKILSLGADTYYINLNYHLELYNNIINRLEKWHYCGESKKEFENYLKDLVCFKNLFMFNK